MNKPEKFSETYYFLIGDEIIERQNEIDKKSKENIERITKRYEKEQQKIWGGIVEQNIDNQPHR